MNIFLIGLGGFLGAISRYMLSKILNERYLSVGYPVGTIAVNIVGTFLLCLLMGLSLKVSGVSKNLILFFCTGFLGSFTTFSTFVFESLSAGTAIVSLPYLSISLFGSFLAGATALLLLEIF